MAQNLSLKAGAAANEFGVSVALSSDEICNGRAAVMVTMRGLGFATDGAEITLMSLSRVGPDGASRQLPAQQGIKACIAVVTEDLRRQHAAAAGTAVMKTTSAMLNAPAKYFVHLQAGFMI